MTTVQLNPRLPSSCPVDGAEDCQGKFFILGNKKLHTGETVAATKEPLPVQKKQHKDEPEICVNWAYSMNSDIQDLQRAQSDFGIMPAKCIYSVELNSDDGMMHNSPNDCMGISHYDWWPANNANVNGIVVQDGKVVERW
jgi:hypothetical protein